MLVKNRYGGVQEMPDRVAQYLIKLGTVTPAEAPKPADVQKSKARKVSKTGPAV